MKLPALPANTPHRPAAVVAAVVGILLILRVPERLGLTAEDLGNLVQYGVIAFAGIAAAFGWGPRKESAP